MRAGRLCHRITIQQLLDDEQDSFGQPKERWSTIAQVWAAVEPYWGRELFVAAREYADLSHRVSIRYRKDLDPNERPDLHAPKMRVLFGEHRIFDVEAVIDIEERHREMQLLCREVTCG